MDVSLGLAFLAGLASFLSPCVLPLVPAYVSYLGGRSAGRADGASRWLTFSHGMAFVLGFSLVFITLGATTGLAASAFGALLYDLRPVLEKIGGIVVIIFGIHMTGLYRIPFLEYDTRRQELPDPKLGYLSSVLMGVFFSAGWSPCVGPTLGAILTLVANGGSVSTGAILLTVYSAGLAIPFLLAALSIDWVTALIKRYGKLMRYTEIAMGVIMIIVGIMLLSGTFQILARFGTFIDFGL